MNTQKCRRGNSMIEQIEVVLDVVVQVWQVGAHLKALVKLESVVPLDLPCIFFTSQTRPPAHCVRSRHVLTEAKVIQVSHYSLKLLTIFK